ncbi:o-succinylbenzoate synthase [cf. Phormidesmis sp. LEGE 11477]|uniref:o-succinylbenzoate synthase n=1 Tax=cf. Phormidesmis sp. LEGE 11477 TaxID=1828680 RepID=UPI00187F4534|nr:o-succinylbenzoate synthase [cf. Phormidesmis sp. LEGE 11477]MBE9059649.1 o-succinylbenzoate synthase [cf. Phormidesmis sp. LEGE 11477]
MHHINHQSAAIAFEFRAYRRLFRRPIKTNHGIWKYREGIILKLSDHQGRTGFGEVAPLPWFGTETQSQAIAFCQQMPTRLSVGDNFSILPTLPACQFGFELAYRNLTRDIHCAELDIRHYSALLPAGEAALNAWSPLWAMGHRTFKWKIGVAPVAVELAWLSQLMERLPLGAQLRLDANGGLCEIVAHHWLDRCDRLGRRIEFIEQPLPPNCFDGLTKLARRYQTPIALDESVTALDQLKAHYYRGWRGIYVVKPAILGSADRLRQFCEDCPIDLVVSSVFETDIGRQALIDLAIALQASSSENPRRALGMGTQQWLPNDGLDDPDWEALWQRLR